VDFENFRADMVKPKRQVFPNFIAHGTKTRRMGVVIFGSLGECQILYSN